jgi:hypothetical protein
MWCIFCIFPSRLLPHDINVWLHLTVMKTNWNSEGVSVSLGLLLVILRAKICCFHFKTPKKRFWSQGNSSSDGIWSLRSFLLHPANRSNHVKWRTVAYEALRPTHTCTLGFTNWYSAELNAYFSEQILLKTIQHYYVVPNSTEYVW